jgi:hypothetical protein
VAAVASTLVCCSKPPDNPPQAISLRTIERPTRVIKIPVRQVTAASVPIDSARPGELAVLPQAVDQLPEGPTSFAVLRDGRLVIADPIHSRLAVYSAEGVYQRSIATEGPVSEVSSNNGTLVIVIATDGVRRSIDEGGRPLADAAGVAPSLPQTEARLESARTGVVRFTTPPAGGVAPGPPEVRIELSGEGDRLASLEVLQGASGRPLYVSAESAEQSGRSLADIGTIIRRYSSTGSLQLEVRNIPLDYYIPPITPFRVQSDVVYQLVPRLDGVTINVWDLR